MPALRRAALLIGVDDYTAYDASMNLPPDTSNLRGGRNDAVAWYAIARALGIPADRITLLTSPILTLADLPPGAEGTTLGPATRSAILTAIDALGERLDGGDPAQGLLSFSGHGA